MFVLTVVFGLFHGLVLFPVLLSVLGPSDEPSRPEEAPEPAEQCIMASQGTSNPAFSSEEFEFSKESSIVSSGENSTVFL